MSRQQLEGQPQEFVPGYEKELQHMLDRRLRLLGLEEEAGVRQTSPIVSMRMLLGVKKDGRRKARLILQGFKEPSELKRLSILLYRSIMTSRMSSGNPIFSNNFHPRPTEIQLPSLPSSTSKDNESNAFVRS